MAELTIAEIEAEQLKIAEPAAEAKDESVTIAKDVEPLIGAEQTKERPADEPAPKRKPGRPLGAKSKEPGKPRQKRAQVVTIAPVEPPAVPAPERVLSGSQPIPQMSCDRKSAIMLALLQQQTNECRQRKVDRWNSWFR